MAILPIVMLLGHQFMHRCENLKKFPKLHISEVDDWSPEGGLCQTMKLTNRAVTQPVGQIKDSEFDRH